MNQEENEVMAGTCVFCGATETDPDGRLATSGGGGVWLWNMDVDASINRICAIAGKVPDP